MNVIFIIVDAMRWDYLSANGYPRPTTPNIDALAAESCVFSRAYATINQTDMSLTSIFSGLYPLTHGLEQTAAEMPIEALKKLNAWHLRYLPQLLRHAGFRTVGIDWLDRWHRWGYDWYQARDERQGLSRLRPIGRRFPGLATRASRAFRRLGGRQGFFTPSKPGIDARQVTDKALSILRQNGDQGLFLFLHYWDAHAPYASQNRYLEQMRAVRLPGEERPLRPLIQRLCHSMQYKNWARHDVAVGAQVTGELIVRYCASLRAIDEQIGRLISYVDAHGLTDETVLIITADHGENLFEDGYFIEHSGLRENVLRVPLLVRLPGVKPRTIRSAVSHVDLLPTLLDCLALPAELQADVPALDGLTLLPLMTGTGSLARSQVFFQSRLGEGQWGLLADGRYKYIECRLSFPPPCPHCGQVHHPQRQLFDLREDGDERNNLVWTHSALSQRLAGQLRRLTDELIQKRAELADRASDRPDTTYTEGQQRELENRLRQLGYIE